MDWSLKQDYALRILLNEVPHVPYVQCVQEVNNGVTNGIIIIIIYRFLQGIYTCIPETNYASRVYSFATILIYDLCHT